MSIPSWTPSKKQRHEPAADFVLLPLPEAAGELEKCQEKSQGIALRQLQDLSRSYLTEWFNEEWPASSLNASLLSPKFEENNPSQENFFPDSSASVSSLSLSSFEKQELDLLIRTPPLLLEASPDDLKAYAMRQKLPSNSSVAPSSSSLSSSLGTVPNPKKTKRKEIKSLENESLSSKEEGFLNALIKGTLDDGSRATQHSVCKVYEVSVSYVRQYARYIKDKIKETSHKISQYPSSKKWKALDAYVEMNRQKIVDYINRRKIRGSQKVIDEDLSTEEENFLNALITGTLDNGRPATRDAVCKAYKVTPSVLAGFSRYIRDKASGTISDVRRYPAQKKWKALDAYAENNKQQILAYIGRKGPDKRKLILSGESEKKEIKKNELRSGIVPPDQRIRN